MLEDRLQILVDDGGVIDMLKVANRYFKFHLFLVHVVSETEVMEGSGEDGVEGRDDCGKEGDVEDDGGKEGDVEDDVGEADEEEGDGEDIGEHDC